MTHLKNLNPLLVLIITLLSLSSCGKKDEIIAALSQSDAAEIIESNFQSNVGGLTTTIEDIAEQLILAVEEADLCDQPYIKTVEQAHQGAQFEGSYNSDITYTMTCSGIMQNPQTAAVTVQSAASYVTPKISSDDNSGFSGVVSGLQGLQLMLEGTFESTGVQEVSISDPMMISSQIEINLSSLVIEKLSLSIIEGDGSFSFTGSTQDEVFEYEGTIIFNGDNSATLIINGEVHIIDWN